MLDDTDPNGQQKGDRYSASGAGIDRRGFLVSAGVAGAVGLAGCSGGNGSGGGDDGGASAGNSGSDATTITAAAASGTGGLIEQLFEEHVSPETGIEIETSILPYSNLFEKLTTSLGNESTDFDLFAMDDPWMPRMAEYLAPIRDYTDELPTDQLIDSTLQIGTWPPEEFAAPPGTGGEPQLKALCAVGNSHLLVYNQEYYDQVGIGEPETWTEIHEAGRQITEDIDGADGYAIRGKNGNPIMASYFSVGMSMAGPMFDEEFRFNWADDQGVEAARFFLEDLRSISPDGVAAWDSEDVLNSLGQGRTAAAPQWPSGASVLLQEDKSPEYENISFTGIPEGAARSAAQQGNWLLGINTFTSESKKQAAGDVIRSFVSKDAQQEYVDLGGVPFRHDSFQDNMDAQPWFPALYKSLQNAVPRPRTPLWGEIETVTGQALNNGLVGDLTPEEAVQQAKADVESTLEENGYYS